MGHVIWLDDCAERPAEEVGGKAIGLGCLLRDGFPVPPGFAIGTDAYRQHLAEGGVPPTIAAEILAAYERLGAGPVAVRSSAAGEDSASFSFAGQQETYLWISGGDEVLRHVVRCWASLFTPQAVAYRARVEAVGEAAVAQMAVVVQEMVPAIAAGVMMTIDPVTGDRSQICIESSLGLGGEVTPDRYCVDKVTLDLRSETLGRKHLAYRFDPDAGVVRSEPVPPEAQEAPSLTRPEVVALAALGKRIERALGAPQDIEWALTPDREIRLLQSRPETVWSRQAPRAVSRPGTSVMDDLLGTITGSRYPESAC
jgi:pyruvate,water dikinase